MDSRPHLEEQSTPGGWVHPCPCLVHSRQSRRLPSKLQTRQVPKLAVACDRSESSLTSEASGRSSASRVKLTLWHPVNLSPARPPVVSEDCLCFVNASMPGRL